MKIDVFSNTFRVLLSFAGLGQIFKFLKIFAHTSMHENKFYTQAGKEYACRSISPMIEHLFSQSFETKLIY